MADETVPAAPAPDAEIGKRPNWMDWAGGVAAILLAVILADIWSDGRVITRWVLRPRGGEGGGDEQRPGE